MLNSNILRSVLPKAIFMAAAFSFPFVNAHASHNKEITALYQELCAKERDPVKRQNYCHLFENSDAWHSGANVFRQDRALV